MTQYPINRDIKNTSLLCEGVGKNMNKEKYVLCILSKANHTEQSNLWQKNVFF